MKKQKNRWNKQNVKKQKVKKMVDFNRKATVIALGI